MVFHVEYNIAVCLQGRDGIKEHEHHVEYIGI